jgi:hypothetical protein
VTRYAIGLHALTWSPAEHHAPFASSRDSRAHALAQQIPLELRERRHQGGDEFALRAAQIELQPGLCDQGNVPRLQILAQV